MSALPEGALARAFGQFQCLVESRSSVMPTLDEWRDLHLDPCARVAAWRPSA
jgi:hypothetical protein